MSEVQKAHTMAEIRQLAKVFGGKCKVWGRFAAKRS